MNSTIKVQEYPRSIGVFAIPSGGGTVSVPVKNWRSYMIYGTHQNATGMTFILVGSNDIREKVDIFGNADLTYAFNDGVFEITGPRKGYLTIVELGTS